MIWGTSQSSHLPPHTAIIPSQQRHWNSFTSNTFLIFTFFKNITTCLFYLNFYNTILHNWAQTPSDNLSFDLDFFHSNLPSIHRTSPLSNLFDRFLLLSLGLAIPLLPLYWQGSWDWTSLDQSLQWGMRLLIYIANLTLFKASSSILRSSNSFTTSLLVGFLRLNFSWPISSMWNEIMDILLCF